MDVGTLAEYLRARREIVTPAEAGLVVTGRRRVTGLRRAEVATLAGVSGEYYARLEQGRDRHPSASVVASLARALLLDEDATAHLFGLAELAPPRRSGAAEVRIPEETLALLRSLEGVTPAYVFSPLAEVLAANALARVVLPTLEPGTNFIRSVFLDETAQRLYVNVEDRQAAAVAHLRFRAGLRADPVIDEFVVEMSAASVAFKRLWVRYEVAGEFHANPLTIVRHPEVGRLELLHHKLLVPGTNGLGVGLLHAEPGSNSERALAALGATAVRAASVGDGGARSERCLKAQRL